MFKWLSEKLGNSPAHSASGSPSPSPRRLAENTGNHAWNAAFASDPAEWEHGFDNCWIRAEKLLDKPLLFPDKDITFEEMSELMSLVTHMVQFLMMEVNAQPEPAIGPILDRFFTNQIVERVLDWAQQCPDFLRPSCQLHLIRIYEHIVIESHSQNHCLLVHKPVLNPLLRLFAWCRKPECQLAHRDGGPSKTDQHFVILLNQICTKMAEDATLFHFFFTCTDEFMVFTLLIPFLYEMNDTGQLARDALLLILSVSSKQQEVAEFVAYKSAFCPVVATGLGGCFSQLSFMLAGDGSERFVPELAAAAHLSNFHCGMVFCNAVVQAAHKAVVDKIAEYFYSGFLILVVKPALLQDDKDAVAAATVYLQVCLETLTEAALVRTVIRMLLVEREEEEERSTLLAITVKRIEAGDKLSVVSLSLLERLLDLSCEDVMLVLALRPLLAMRGGVTRAQLARVRDRVNATALAHRLLAAVPVTMQRIPEVSSHSTFNQYVREAAEMVDGRARGCTAWKWKYDGVHPSPMLFRADSDDDGHMPFTRLSSVRSSVSSAAANGLNRYCSSGSARSRHLTAESIAPSTVYRLGELGSSPLRSPSNSIDEDESPIEEDADFVLPPINCSSMMQSSMVDYLTLTAYDSLSESDGGDKEMMIIVEDEKEKEPSKSEGRKAKEDSGGDSSSVGFDTDAEMSRSFVLSGWTDVKDMDTFMSLLDRRPAPKGVTSSSSSSKSKGKEMPPSMGELTSFIDARLQYMRECAGEEDDKENDHPTKGADGCASEDGFVSCDVGVRGQPIEEEADSRTQLIKVLLRKLDSMCDQSVAFNLQLCSLIYTLASFPQPLLVNELYRVNASDGLYLIGILESLKTRVDGELATIEGADMWIRRALRTLEHRADRIDRAPDAVFPRPISIHRDGSRDMDHTGHAQLSRARPFGGSARRYGGFRYHSHITLDNDSAREDARAKELAHVAVILANLCQMLAAIALHHAVVVVNRQ